MANILYGVNGEGAGHSTRAREVITHLLSRGHHVRAASFDRGLANLTDLCESFEIFGFRFAYVNNRVRYRRTVARNLAHSRHAARSFRCLLENIEAWNIDLVITDFEPLTCQAGRHCRVPVICIDNQHCLTNAQVSIPRECRRDAAAAKLVTRLMTPRADAYLVTSFFPAPVKARRTFLFPPILRQAILQATPVEGNRVLVYVTSPAPALARLLTQVRAEFAAYGFGREGREGNIEFRKPGMQTFLRDLVTAKAVIANAGFSLVTEALHLGKPYLAIPVAHQFEQAFNAFWLQKQGYGAYWNELEKECIDTFMSNLPLYRERLARYPHQGNDALFAKLDSLIAELTSRKRSPRGNR